MHALINLYASEASSSLFTFGLWQHEEDQEYNEKVQQSV